VPGKVAESMIVDALRHEGLKMPPTAKLPDAVIADFVKWIEMGAPDPRNTPANPDQATELARAAKFEQLKQWWSLQPVVKPEPPATSNREWSSQPIDRFVLAELESRKLSPAAQADRRTLVRRLSFALLGLPPTAHEVSAFVDDASPDAWERLVDRYLASPHFGERWARHWMDVVRYGDTYGYEWDIPAKGAWRYRDYLTRAFNADVPLDQLIREQIAGDLLDEPRINAVDQVNESLIGTMFFQMGEKRHGDSAEFDGIHQEMLDNKIDAFSKAFQAMTIACARCHDHKLDPVLQSEYYALGGVFMSSRWVTNTVDLPQSHEPYRVELKELKRKLRGQIARQWRDDLAALSAESIRKARQSGGDKEPPLEDVFHAWYKAQQATETDIADAWKTLAARYRDEAAQRVQKNAGQFTILADFRQEIPAGWSVDGVGLNEVVPRGDFTVALEGEAAIGQILHGGLVTHALSPRLNGALRTPHLNTFEPGNLSFEIAGGDFAARRSVIDNAFLCEKQQYLNARHPQWMLVDTFPGMKERHIYLELATKTSNPNFPPRVGLGGECSEQQAADPKSWFAISRVVRHQAAFSPHDELTPFAKLFEGDPPADLDGVAKRYAQWVRAALAAWEADKATDEDVRILNAMLDAGLLTNRCDDAELRDLVQRYRTVERSMPEPWTVNGMADVEAGFDLRLNVRGEYDQFAEAVPRGYVSALPHADHAFAIQRSGRKQLADLIASPSNPLTARVFVNRVWQWLFGAGIVASTNDFGHLGELPSHPELLDYLAARFVEERWSVKKLVREIVLSSAWQQASTAAEAAGVVDPANRLLSHFSLRRLEAEAIRDSMLVCSGRFDAQLYGPPINPHRQNEDPQKRLFSGPIDGNGRRSLYTRLTIMEPPRLLALFNQPPPKIPTGTRDVTSTPAQSLALLNDPFVSEQAERWAQRLVAEPHANVAARLEAMWLTAYGRPPMPKEAERWTRSVHDLSALHNVKEADLMGSVPIWKEIAHTLFNTKEFIYIR